MERTNTRSRVESAECAVPLTYRLMETRSRGARERSRGASREQRGEERRNASLNGDEASVSTVSPAFIGPTAVWAPGKRGPRTNFSDSLGARFHAESFLHISAPERDHIS